MPRLYRLIHHRDTKIRSSASSALVSLLKRHSVDENTVFTFIDVLTAPLQVSPSDIGEIDDGNVQYDVGLIVHWIQATSPEIYSVILMKLLEKCLSNPNDPLFVQVISKFGMSEKFDTTICRLVTKRIDLYIKEERDTTSVFSQLIPLLILKNMPNLFFDQNYDDIVILFEFIQKCIVSHPLNELKRLCAEIAGRFSSERVYSELFKKLKDFVSQRDWSTTKALLYSLCSLALNQKSNKEEMSNLCFDLLDQKCENDEMYKVQHGSIELLSILIKNNGFSDLLEKVLSRLKNGNDVVQICMINTLTSCAKYTSMVEINGLAEKTMNILISMSGKVSEKVRVGCCQAILHYCHKLKDGVFPYVTNLFQMVKLQMSDKSPDLRLSGLKLLSAILVTRDDVIKGHEKIFEEIQLQIHRMSNVESNSDVLALAIKLKEIMTN
jgi:hypothetical protein